MLSAIYIFLSFSEEREKSNQSPCQLDDQKENYKTQS